MQGRAAIQVGRRADDDGGEGAHLPHDIGALERQFPGMHGQVDRIVHEVQGRLLVHEIDGKTLISLQQHMDARGDHDPAEHRLAADPHQPGGAALARADGALRLLDGQQHGLCRTEEIPAFFGQTDTTGGAMDQPGTQMLFEGGDLAGNGRLRDAPLAGHGRERPSFGDADEDTQGGE